MIRTEREHKEAVRRLKQNKTAINKQEDELKNLNLSPEEIKTAMDPVLCFHQDMVAEVETYEKLKRQDYKILKRINHIGQQLVALRIFSGLTQSELAKCLKVSVAQVSRDERNEYHGISFERAQKIVNVFGGQLQTSVKLSTPVNRKNIIAACR